MPYPGVPMYRPFPPPMHQFPPNPYYPPGNTMPYGVMVSFIHKYTVIFYIYNNNFV